MPAPLWERHRRVAETETQLHPTIQALVASPFFKPKKGLITTKRLSAGPAAAYAASVGVTTLISASSRRDPSRSGKVLIRSKLQVYIAVDSPESVRNAFNRLDSWPGAVARGRCGSSCQTGHHRRAPGCRGRPDAGGHQPDPAQRLQGLYSGRSLPCRHRHDVGRLEG